MIAAQLIRVVFTLRPFIGCCSPKKLAALDPSAIGLTARHALPTFPASLGISSAAAAWADGMGMNRALYQQEDEPQKAIKHFQRVTELNPTDAEAFFNVGVLLVGANQLEKAETAYKTGIELQPKSIEGQFNLGAFYEFHKKDLPQAKKHYQNYLQLGGADTRIQQLLDKLQP